MNSTDRYVLLIIFISFFLEHPKNLTKELEPSENEQNMEESLSCNDKVRKMVSLNKRLGIFYQDLFIIENGLDNFEDDFSFNTKTKEIIPDQSNIFEMLVQGGLHLQFIHIRMKNVLEFNERLRNRLKRIQSTVYFREEGKERSKCPKFSSDEQCIHDTFNYIHEEIIALKHDFEKLLDYLDDE